MDAPPPASEPLPRISRARSAAASARQAGAANKHDAEECGLLSQRSLSCQALHPADKMQACGEHIASYRACTQQLRERKAAERAAQRAGGGSGAAVGVASLLLAVVAACALLGAAEAVPMTVTEIKPGAAAGGGGGGGSGGSGGGSSSAEAAARAAASAAAAALPPSQAAAAAAAREAAKDGDKRSPLHELALGTSGGSSGAEADAAAAAAVRRALAADASIKVDDKDRFGWTALHYAASEGSAAMVRALLAAGANHDALDNWGERALHKAAQRGQAASLAALLAAGANANAMDKNMRGPLIEAASEGHVECVRRLLEAGAFEGTKTTYDSTPLSVAKGAETKALLRERAAKRDADTAAESKRLREEHEAAMRDSPPVPPETCEDPSGDKPRRLDTIEPKLVQKTIRVDARTGKVIETVEGAKDSGNDGDDEDDEDDDYEL
jgi:hypothetical protein